MVVARSLTILALVFGGLSCGGQSPTVESFDAVLCPNLVEVYEITSSPGGRLESPENEEKVRGLREIEAALMDLSGEISEAGLAEDAERIRTLAASLSPLADDMTGMDNPESYAAIAESILPVALAYLHVVENLGSRCPDVKRPPSETP